MNETSSERTEQGTSMAGQGVRRLLRRRDGKMIAGVANGLGAYFGVDPVWFRLGFVVTTFLGGAGIVAYGVLWLVMPDGSNATAEPAILERQAEKIAHSMRATPSWIGIALLVLGGLLVVTQVTHWRPGVFWGVAFIVLGVFLFRRFGEPSVPALPTAPAAPGAIVGTEAPTAPIPHPAAPSSLRVKRERSSLGWLALGAVLVGVGVAAALDRGGAVHVTLVQYLALALAIIGAGMLVGAWVGRARWLIVPAIALVPFVLVASLIKVPFKGGFAYEVLRPANVAAASHEYHLVGGKLVLDLRQLKLAASPVTIVATDVFGRILVHVPPNTALDIRARAGAGNVVLFGHNYNGVNVDVRRKFPATSPAGAGTLTLDLETSLGQVEVSS